MTGRKRQLLVDPPGTPGAMLSVVVQPAASQDRDGAAAVLAQAAAPTTRVQQRWAAAAERGGGGLARWVTAAGGWTIAIEPRAPATVGCAVQPRRWVGGPHLRVAGPLPAVAPGLCSISGHQRDRDGVGHVCAVTPPVVPTFISVVHPLRIGDHISVDGKMSEIHSYEIQMGDCRILTLESPEAGR